MTTKKKNRPFKMIYCDEPGLFLMPAPALQIWMRHYFCEPNVHIRQSFPSLEFLQKTCGMNRATVCKWRTWLVDNGWLKLIGKKKVGGVFGVPVYRTEYGTVPIAADKRTGNDPAKARQATKAWGKPTSSVKMSKSKSRFKSRSRSK
jgi:hypothetical protein